jgi:hypothetical protein
MAMVAETVTVVRAAAAATEAAAAAATMVAVTEVAFEPTRVRF